MYSEQELQGIADLLLSNGKSNWNLSQEVLKNVSWEQKQHISYLVALSFISLIDSMELICDKNITNAEYYIRFCTLNCTITLCASTYYHLTAIINGAHERLDNVVDELIFKLELPFLSKSRCNSIGNKWALCVNRLKIKIDLEIRKRAIEEDAKNA